MNSTGCWNPDHSNELLELGRHIDWARLDAACGVPFVDQVGPPGLPTRLMAGQS